MYFCEIENFAYGEINERSFSNPHPSAVISPSAYNSCFVQSCCHFPLSGIWLDSALAVDTLPINLLQKKHIFNGAIDVTNLEHWLMHLYVSLSLHFDTTLHIFMPLFWMVS